MQTVSIVIPVYNGGNYLEAAILSVLAQTYEQTELLVVDDGSTDRSAAIAAGFSGKLRLIRQGNGGQSAALTAGWAAAKGQILGYLSADDLLRPDAVLRAVEALQDRREIVLAYPDFNVIDAEANVTSHVQAPDFSRYALYGQLRCLPGPGALFRRSAYERAGPWNRDFRHMPDLEFFLRLGLEGDFERLPQTLASFRKHTGSTTYSAAPAERGEEPTRLVASFYGRQDLPADIRSWQRPAQAHALLLSAIIHAQSDRIGPALRRLASAVATQPCSLLSRRGAAAVVASLNAARQRRILRRGAPGQA